ncbi:MAG TPA: HDIG domain-containing protein, partial [Armatimonadota bacterium]
MMKRSKLPHWPPRFPVKIGWLRWRTLSKALLALLTTALLTTIISMHLDYYQIGSRLEQFRVGQPAPRDVVARSLVNWDDAADTQRKRDEAAGRVPTYFIEDTQAVVKSRRTLDALFASMTKTPATSSTPTASTESSLPREVLADAHALDAATRERVYQTAQTILAAVMQARIEEGQESEAAQRIITMTKSLVNDAPQQRVIITLAQMSVRPTWVKDALTTRVRQDAAREQIRPVVRQVRTGEVVIPKGSLLTDRDLTQLTELQLLTPAPLTRLLPLALMMFFAVTSLGIFVRQFARPLYDTPRKMALLSGLILATVWACVTLGGEQHESMVALMAIPAGSMAIAGLLGVPTAIAATMLLSMSAGLAADHQFSIILLTMGSALAGIMAVTAIWPASRAIPAVFSLFVVNLVLLVGVESILPGGGFDALWPQIWQLSQSAGAGALGATFIAVGAIYILARPFGITTHYRLMELSNPNEPLLRRMMLEAPGSYHSSVMVANIAEAAADAVGANALLTRVAALYHDVGKIKRPGFFVENQAPLGIENMHQRLSPKLSYLILTSHVKEGQEIAKEYKLPEEVISIVREHHGTTLAAYFYHRAVSEAGDAQVPEH